MRKHGADTVNTALCFAKFSWKFPLHLDLCQASLLFL